MTATPTPCPACRQPMSHLTLPKRDAGHVDLDWWQGAPRVQIRVVDAADPARSRF